MSILKVKNNLSVGDDVNIERSNPLPNNDPMTVDLCNEKSGRIRDALETLVEHVDESDHDRSDLRKDLRSEILIIRNDLTTVERRVAILHQWKDNGRAKMGVESKKTMLWFSVTILVITIISNLDKISRVIANLVK